MKLVTKLSFIIILFTFNAKAGEIITPLPSIFDNVSIISSDDLKNIITQELENEGVEGKLEINLYGNEKGLQLNTSQEKFDVEVLSFSFHDKSRRFKSKVVFSGKDFIKTEDISGRYAEIVEIPALSYKMPYDTVITSSDIEIIEVQKRKILHDTITDADYLIGKKLKRSMSEHRPIRKRDIDQQELVSRNNIISMVYHTPFIKLRAKGVALEDGSEGDFIKVRNAESNKIVRALVKENGTVLVEATGIL